MRSRWLALFLLLGGLLLLWEHTRLDARLIPIKGSTTVHRSGGATVVETGPGDRLALFFQDHGLVKLDENSRLLIPEAAIRKADARGYAGRRIVQVASAALAGLPGPDPAGIVLGDTPSRLELQRGRLWGQFPIERSITVATESGDARSGEVKAETRGAGTTFALARAEDGTATLQMEEGSAAFSNKLGRVLLRESQESVARPGQAPAAPVTVNLPVAIEWTNDVLPQPPLEIRFVSQDPKRLEAALREAEALPPGAERLRRLGDVRHDRGELAEALAAYEQALRAMGVVEPRPAADDSRTAKEDGTAVFLAGAESDSPAAIRVLARMGHTLLELGQLPEAEAALRRSLQGDPGAPVARAGLATLLLTRGDVEAAWVAATGRGDATAPGEPPSMPGAGSRKPGADGAEAASVHLALAVIELRRGRLMEAGESLDQARAADPENGQVYAWRSVLLRQRKDLEGALTAARRAVALAPRSATTHQALADAYLLSGSKPEMRQKAREHARQAAALNPLSAATRLSRANAELLNGRVDLAVREARAAVALDPRSDRGHYTLGAALAGERRYPAAQRHLERAIALNDDLLEARSLLGRVLIQQGRPSVAAEVATAAVERDPEQSGARAVLGIVHRLRGDLRAAAEAYEDAIARAPGNGLYRLEAARVYLDLNDLPTALRQAQEAVLLLPGSSEARAVLGLVYDRQNSRAQALREYRAALALSPDNALARLGLATSFQPGSFGVLESGQERLRERAQALLRDPAVLQQVWEPGVTSEFAGALAQSGGNAERILHRGQASGGRVHDLTVVSRFSDKSGRENGDGHGRTLQSDIAVQATPTTQVLLQFLEERFNSGLPGALDQPDLDGFARRRRRDLRLNARQALGPNTQLWLGHGIRDVDNVRTTNPDARAALTVGGPVAASDPWPGLSRFGSEHHRDERVTELRLDHRLGRHRLSYGLAHVRQDLQLFVNRYRAEGDTARRTTVLEESASILARDLVHYVQDDYRVSDRGTLIVGAQLRRTRDLPVQELRSSVLLPPDQPRLRVEGERTTSDHFLPYLAFAYDLGSGDAVRIWGNRTLLRFGNPLLQPSEAFLGGDPINLFVGGVAENFGLELEKRFSAGTFVKGFVQQSRARDFLLQPSFDESFEARGLVIPSVRARIVGARVEQQLNRNLAAFLDGRYQEALDRSDNAYLLLVTQTPGTNFARGLQVPLVPRWRGILGLNYVDASGTKLKLQADLLGPQYTDVGVAGSNSFGTPTFIGSNRARIGSRLFTDLYIGKEPSVGLEYGLTITNLFNVRSVDWPGYPTRGRRWLLSIARRY